MKTQIIYEVALTGSGQNFYTLYRHCAGDGVCISTFVQNLSIDFDEAVIKARSISGEDESTDSYEKKLICDPDEVREIIRLGTSKLQAELEGVMTFGKHKHEKIEDVFKIDKKYVEWIAKGGMVKSKDYDSWYSTIDNSRPIRHQAIALLIGNGDWIERQGKFMSVDKAVKLDYLDSLTINPSIVDGKRVKGLHIRLLSKPYLIDNEYGGKWIYRAVDENNHIYFGSTTSFGNDYKNILHVEDYSNTWFKVDFTPSIYQGKLYIKRVKFISTPISDIKETLEKIENELHNKKTYDSVNFTETEAKQLQQIGILLDSRYKTIL